MIQADILFDSMEWETLHPGFRQKKVESEGIAHRLVEITGEFAEDGWCTKAHHGYIIDGTLRLEFQNGETLLHQGDGLSIPAGVPHKASTHQGGRALFFLADPM